MVDADRCAGCKICELVCSFARDKEYNPKRSFIRVLTNEEMAFFISVLNVRCNLCNAAAKCIKHCPMPRSLDAGTVTSSTKVVGYLSRLVKVRHLRVILI